MKDEKKMVERAEEIIKKLKPKTIDLEEIDALKLHNMVLAEKNEGMRRQLVDRDFADKRKDFYTNVTGKYKIDTELFDIEINPATNKITLKQKTVPISKP